MAYTKTKKRSSARRSYGGSGSRRRGTTRRSSVSKRGSRATARRSTPQVIKFVFENVPGQTAARPEEMPFAGMPLAPTMTTQKKRKAKF